MKLFSLVLVVLFTTAFCAKFSNIEANLVAQLKISDKADVLIRMNEQVDFKPMKAKLESMDWIKRGRFVYNLLTKKAEESQKEVRAFLKESNVEYTNLWIQNTLAVKDMSRSVLLELSMMKSISKISLDAKEIASWETPNKNPAAPKKDEKSAEWNIEWINATKAWANGHTGEGMVLATADSGTNWEHPALKPNYRGNNGDGTYEHNFNWYDPVAKSPHPIDQHSHGTHCQGTVSGGVDRKIGASPGAKWISCRIANRAFVPSNVIACWQFILSPHDLSGRNANPDKRAHVCSHSYTCGTCALDESIAAHRAAGIFVIAAAGNSGSRCSSHGHPARVADVLSIGALGVRSNTIARFSSRGPGLNGIGPKPQFAFPGSSIVSARNTGGYTTMSGTSMAAPLANGAIGLIWGAVPELVGKHAETEEIMKQAALGQTSNDCGMRGSPNNVYGHGTVDINAAIELGKMKYQKFQVKK